MSTPCTSHDNKSHTLSTVQVLKNYRNKIFLAIMPNISRKFAKMHHTFSPLQKLLSLAATTRCSPQRLSMLATDAAALTNWQEVARVAEEHGLAPLFYSHCQAAGVDIPVAVRRQLQVLTLRQQAAQQIRTKALGEILTACTNEGVEILILQGAALAWTVYPSPGLRSVSDFHLLTMPANKSELEEILLNIGYGRSKGEEGVSGSCRLHAGLSKMQDGLPLMVMLQSALLAPNRPGSDMEIATVLKRGRSFMLADVPALGLCPEDQLWQTYYHLIDAPWKLIHYADFLGVAERFADEIDWQEVGKNHPGIVAALELLQRISPLDEHLVHVAGLPVSSRQAHYGNDLANALRATEQGPAMRLHPGKMPGVRDWAVAQIHFEAACDSMVEKCTSHHTLGGAIPKILHQTWKDTTIPEDLAAYRQSWKEHHPDWSFVLWTDGANRELIRRKYTWFLPIYDRYPEAIMRADTARYFILHQFGGVYADLDFQALRPLDPLLQNTQVVVGLEPEQHLVLPLAVERNLHQIICNAFMASIPLHPFWEHVFLKLGEFAHFPGTLDTTGPFLLTRAYATFPEPHQLTVVPPSVLYPIDNTVIFKELAQAEQQSIEKDAYAIHHWCGSWWRQERPRTVSTIDGELRAKGQFFGRVTIPVDRYLSVIGTGEDLPLVSAMMVTKNRSELAKCSVRCFLNQTYPTKELVIIDDGDDDRLAIFVQELNDPQVRIFRLPPEGKSLGELRNLAKLQARGEFVAQWDDDDLSDPQRLAMQMAAILLHQVDACLLQRHMVWYPHQQRLAISSFRQWESSFICRKNKVADYPDLRKGEDTPVIEQITAGRYLWLDYPELYIYTFHSNNTWDGNHFDEFWKSATQTFEGDAYRNRLADLGWRLGIDLSAGGIDHAGRKLPEGVHRQHTLPVLSTPETSKAATIPKVLILIPVKDAVNYLPHCLKNLRSLTYPHARISLGFLESDSQDGTYAWLAKILPDLQREFRGAAIFKRDYGYRMTGSRWELGKQRRRREILARSRNYLLSQTQGDEDWVFWLDVDVAQYPTDVIEQLLAYGKDIAVPNCVVTGTNRQYDLNTYKLKSAADKIDWQPHIIDGLLQPPAGLGRWYLNDLQLFDAVEVDAVGGTMLLIKADLHREGLIFPPYPYRLTIETEGLAAMAKDMGCRCWGLPKVVIHHPAG